MSFRFEAFLRRFSSTVDPWEVKKFRNLSVGWENQGSAEYALLRRINPLRLGYLQTHVSDLKGKRLLDVGCGGGLLSLPLSRLGADVTGIDIVNENIISARRATDKARQRENLRLAWINCPIDPSYTFDVIIASEVIEHVANPDQFVFHCLDLLSSDNGILFISTINSNALSKFLVVNIAESFLRLVPPGTHNPDRFYSPTRLVKVIRDYQHRTKFLVTLDNVQGVTYLPLLDRWIFIPSTVANYFAIITKRSKIKVD